MVEELLGEDAALQVRQTFIELKTCAAAWEEAVLRSKDALQSALNACLRIGYLPSAHWAILGDSSAVRSCVDAALHEDRDAAAEELREVAQAFDELHRRMQAAVAAMQQQVWRCSALAAGEEAEDGKEGALPSAADLSAHDEAASAAELPVRGALSPYLLLQLAERVVAAYDQELLVKRAIVRDAVRQSPTASSTLQIYASAWMLQPFVDKSFVHSVLACADKEVGGICS
eukprot:PLAT5855.1.p1 GENE.PLAT5855.1~~PLAT5855.1.p1  ORF type:complete len:240 (-),score=106.50 PLAT5855.1:64-753(-)